MNYIGDLYGNVNGKYIKLEMTSSDVDLLEKEKCELLGIIQQKDEIIGKMKNCNNCKHKMIILMADILEDEIKKEPCKSCNDLDKWEIKE